MNFIIIFYFLPLVLCDQYINSIYYLGSGIPKPYDFSKVDMHKITHIKYAFANITGNKATLDFESKMQGDKKVLVGHLGSLIKMKQTYRHIKLGLSILGDFGSMVNNENGRNEFVTSVVDLIQQFGFDFIDLDWEFPVRGFEKMGVKGNKDDNIYMLQLLKLLDSQFKSNLKFNCFITIALPSPDYYLSQYDITKIDQYIQYYNAMTYDFSGTFNEVATYASNLYSLNNTGLSVDDSINRMISAGVPNNKLLMGIPAYSAMFRNCERNTFPTKYDLQATLKVAENGFTSINQIDFNKVEQKWNDDIKASWGYFKDQNMLLSYDTAQSVKEKINYIKDKQLRGVMVWALHQDFPITDDRSLIKSSISALGEDNLDKTNNNIEYPNSNFINVKDPNFKVTVSYALNTLPPFNIIYYLLIMITLTI